MPATIKFNPADLVSRLEKSDSSGCLEITEGLVSWKIYLQQGKLKYIDCSIQLLDQLKYYLHYLGIKQGIAGLKQLPSSIKTQEAAKNSSINIYSQAISWLLTEKHLSCDQALKLIEQITKDTFSSVLWLNKGTHSWRDREAIPSWITENLNDCPSLNISDCLGLEKTRLQQWYICSDRLISTHQRPYFNSGWETKTLPTSGSLNLQNLKELAKVIRGRTSIRELSVLLKKDELQVAQILSSYIDQDIICLRDAQSPLNLLPSIPRIKKDASSPSSSKISTDNQKERHQVAKPKTKTWKVVCIDDSPTILKEIQRFLDQDKFEVTAIDDPVKAVPTIFRLKPDLILLDITMPKINGYKLCGLLRGSKNCDQIPIIMVTGNTGFIDKARAKVAGATDYFTKPFTQQGLRQIVEKYLN